MQRPKKGKGSFGQGSDLNHGRIIDLRAWRTRKRMANFRARFNGKRQNLRFIAIALIAVSAMLAVAGCIPSSFQGHLILLCWLVSLVSLLFTLYLSLRFERLVPRFLSGSLLCMAVSFVAALFRLFA